MMIAVAVCANTSPNVELLENTKKKKNIFVEYIFLILNHPNLAM
jgi:hypothetical protein